MATPHEVRDVLLKAADRIEPEGRWHRGYFAADAEGRNADFGSRSAAAWCAWGAISREVEEAAGDVFLEVAALELLESFTGGESIGSWNDHGTQAEVVAALRKAADLALEAK